jgi:membrane protease subunit (stomatin/prohibitin family)
METVKKAAEELGKSPGAGLGTGMVLIPQVMTPTGPAQAPAAALVICPKCSAKVPATSKFCPDCGTQLAPPVAGTIKCPKCGHPIPSTSKFCPECGAKIE